MYHMTDFFNYYTCHRDSCHPTSGLTLPSWQLPPYMSGLTLPSWQLPPYIRPDIAIVTADTLRPAWHCHCDSCHPTSGLTLPSWQLPPFVQPDIVIATAATLRPAWHCYRDSCHPTSGLTLPSYRLPPTSDQPSSAATQVWPAISIATTTTCSNTEWYFLYR